MVWARTTNNGKFHMNSNSVIDILYIQVQTNMAIWCNIRYKQYRAQACREIISQHISSQEMFWVNVKLSALMIRTRFTQVLYHLLMIWSGFWPEVKECQVSIIMIILLTCSEQRQSWAARTVSGSSGPLWSVLRCHHCSWYQWRAAPVPKRLTVIT